MCTINISGNRAVGKAAKRPAQAGPTARAAPVTTRMMSAARPARNSSTPNVNRTLRVMATLRTFRNRRVNIKMDATGTRTAAVGEKGMKCSSQAPAKYPPRAVSVATGMT